MGRIVIASPALSDAGALTTPGAVAASLPLANLQDMQPSKVCRFTNLTGMAVVCDLGAAAAINLIALVAHNGSAAATWRIRAAATEAVLTAAPGYDSTAVSMWPASGQPSGWAVLPSTLFLATAQSFRWWRIDITDAANPAGYWQAGRLVLAAAWQPSRNLQFGWGLGHIDPSEVSAAAGGQLLVEERTKRRVVSFTLSFMDEDEMMVNAFEIERARGAARDVVVIRDPDATSHLHRQTVHGLMTGGQPIVNDAVNVFRKPYRLEELIP